jgi:Fe-S-cluster containining protein
MEIERKLKALDRIYAVYDNFVRTQAIACKLHCHACCTSHVVLTTLEAYKILKTLPPGELQKLYSRIQSASDLERFRPTTTTNALAEEYAADEDLPTEPEEATRAKCPLLAAELCSIYALRPFNCRCFVSRTPCAERGYADMDETLVAVNTLFLQTVEHVDADGCSGNLLDVLMVLADEETRAAYCSGAMHCSADGLVANRPMRVLMVPPEHRQQIEPILQRLRAIRV